MAWVFPTWSSRLVFFRTVPGRLRNSRDAYRDTRTPTPSLGVFTSFPYSFAVIPEKPRTRRTEFIKLAGRTYQTSNPKKTKEKCLRRDSNKYCKCCQNSICFPVPQGSIHDRSKQRKAESSQGSQKKNSGEC